jgi:DNA recombination protein RmuC
MLIFLVIANVITIGTTVYFIAQNNNNKKNLSEKEKQITLFNQEQKEFQQKIDCLIHYQGKYEQLEKDTKKIYEENGDLKNKNEILNSEKNEVDKNKELIKQEKDNLLKEKEEWGKDKENLLKKLSLDLLQKNSEINNENNKNNQAEVQKITEKLLKDFENINNKVFSLDDNGKKVEKTLDTMRRALLNPGGAGLSSETTLANILKASNLREKKDKDSEGDYILQPSFKTHAVEAVKRPDAIVYLPNNNYIIIDSKSSSHFMHLQTAVDNKDAQQEEEFLKKIKIRMNKHLEDLKSKDYQEAQRDYLTNQDINNVSPTIMTIMFLQTEGMLEIIGKADKNFALKCFKAGIPLATPVALINLLNTSKYSIHKEQQDKNIGKLKIELGILLENIFTLFGHSDKLGDNLNKALKGYNAFAGTMNKAILARFKNINRLGIEAKKQAPNRLKRYDIDPITIEGEAEETEKIEDQDDNQDNLLSDN